MMDRAAKLLTYKAYFRKNSFDRCSQGGFTLIEMILVLILMGIGGVFASMGLSQLTTSFLFTRENAQTAGKAQLAVLRITKELMTLNAVTNASASSLRFTTLHPGGAVMDYTLFADGNGNLILLNNNSASADVLTDQVSAFSFAYYDAHNGAAQTTWTGSRKEIEFSLTVVGANAVASPFVSRVTPRNL